MPSPGPADQVPPAIVRRGFTKDFNALAEHQVTLGITDAELRFIQNYRRESWNPKAPPPSIRKLASKYGKSRGSLYALRRALIAKGYAVAQRQFAADQSCLASLLDFSSLWRKLAELDRATADPLPDGPADPMAGPRVSPPPERPAACLPEDAHSPLTRGPATRRSPEDSSRGHVDPEEPSDRQIANQWNAVGRRGAAELGAKARDVQDAFVAQLRRYAAPHQLGPRDIDKLLQRAVHDGRWKTIESIFAGLDVYRAVYFPQKGAAA